MMPLQEMSAVKSGEAERSVAQPPVKVVHVITRDEGGGGRAAFRLNSGLNRVGCDARLFVGTKIHPDPRTVVFRPSSDAGAKLRRAIYRARARVRNRAIAGRDEEWNWDIDCQRGIDPLAQLPGADLYNLHTISNFVDYAAFLPAVTAKAPVVWTFHLMAPFTGGCSNSFGCERYQQECGACPMLHSTDENDLSHRLWSAKQRIYSAISATRLHLVCPSQWMRGQLSRSSLMGRFPATVIPNGLDTDAYAPRDRRFARETLGIPPEAKVLLFISQHTLRWKGKGFDLLLEMLRRMNRPRNLHLVTLGQDCTFDIPVPHRHIGHLFDDRVLSMVYSAADLFITPSLQDNFPNVALEAISCGTPVVGFEVGGIPEIVRNNQTGEVVPVGDVDALGGAVERLLGDDAGRQEFSRRCREVAVREFSNVLQGERYLKLYREMLAGGPEVRRT
jgi:glycosyltransferase involved in cell wall biosynthesis